MLSTIITLAVMGINPFAPNQKPVQYEDFLVKVATLSIDAKYATENHISHPASIAKDFKDATLFFVVNPKTAVNPTGKIETELVRVKEWLKRMSKTDLYDKLAKAPWVAYKDVTHHDEPLIAQTTWGGEHLFWSFGKKNAAMLVDLGSQRSFDNEAKTNEFALNFLNDHLALPDRPQEGTMVRLHRYGDIWGGYVCRGLVKHPDGSQSTPWEWDGNFLVITDGRYVLARWVLMVPEDQNPGLAAVGYSTGKPAKTHSRFDD
jgi:hypothetical protein